jgi:hypothetical protein
LTEIRDPEPTLAEISRFRRKPPKTGYTVSAVPKRYQDQVQLSAVLRHVYGRLRTDTDYIDATGWALHHWRHRAFELAEAHFHPFAPKHKGGRQRLPNASSCPVAFVMTYDGKKGRKPCNMRTICPFCWARDVRKQWMKVDAAFFPAASKKRRVRMVDTDDGQVKSSSFTHSVKDGEIDAKSTYDLIRRTFTFHLPAELTVQEKTSLERHTSFPMHAMMAWLKSRIHGQPLPALHRLSECRGLLEAAGPNSGLLEAIHFRRIASDQESEYPWEVQVRQLIMAADSASVPRSLPNGICKPMCHISIPRPSRRVVVAAVAWALQYPKFLIDPHVPVENVIEYLKVRRGLRLVANYGRFRTKHT